MIKTEILENAVMGYKVMIEGLICYQTEACDRNFVVDGALAQTLSKEAVAQATYLGDGQYCFDSNLCGILVLELNHTMAFADFAVPSLMYELYHTYCHAPAYFIKRRLTTLLHRFQTPAFAERYHQYAQMDLNAVQIEDDERETQ